MASLATRSSSVAGSIVASSARVRRSRSAWAAWPSGDRSVSSWSWPATPTYVAPMGSSAAHASTYRLASSSIRPTRWTLPGGGLVRELALGPDQQGGGFRELALGPDQ